MCHLFSARLSFSALYLALALSHSRSLLRPRFILSPSSPRLSAHPLTHIRIPSTRPPSHFFARSLPPYQVNHTPLFPGDSEIDELFRIFRKLGTPNTTTWPDVTRLDNFQPTLFPQWGRKQVETIVPRLCGNGHYPVNSETSANLLLDMLRYEPRRCARL
jgi:hypothetical protein